MAKSPGSRASFTVSERRVLLGLKGRGGEVLRTIAACPRRPSARQQPIAILGGSDV